MEEVDNIIIHTLRQIGCGIEDDVSSLKQFNTELVVEATVRCLQLINPSLQLSHNLPPGMSARFRIGSTLAQACTDLGYQGEIGYQTFLYSGETDIRKVFIFLIEKLPKESEKTIEEPLDSRTVLYRSISSKLAKRLQIPWLPRYCKVNGIRWWNGEWIREGVQDISHFHSSTIKYPSGLEDLSKKIPTEVKQYYANYQLPVIRQPLFQYQVAPSVLENNTSLISAANEWENEWNQIGLSSRMTVQDYISKKRQRIQKKISDHLKQEIQKNYKELGSATPEFANLLNSSEKDSGVRQKESRFTHSKNLQFTTEEVKTASQPGMIESTPTKQMPSEEEQQKIREDEVQTLRNELDTINSYLESLQLEIRKFTGSIQQMEEQMTEENNKNRELEEMYRVKKKTLDLLPDGDENIVKLQEMMEASAQRLVSLANQWEKHRAPLIEQYRQLKEVNANKLSETQKKVEEIKNLKEKIKELADTARHKEELHKQLLLEYEKMTKDVNRAAYTRRILEIVGNIKKQKQDIDKVLLDTKEVQKEINQLSGKLDRTFTVTDEVIFKDAKKDEAVRKAYKYLAALHENCNQLIKTLEETGIIMREIRDLEDQIENESQKKVLANLERIMADYKQMKQENSVLIGKLKERGDN